jgi:hypothetical protein
LSALGGTTDAPRGNSTSRHSPPNKAAAPGPRRPDREPDLLFENLQIKLYEIGEAVLQHEIRHAAGELRGLVRVAAEADHDVAGALIDRNPLNGFGELIAESR